MERLRRSSANGQAIAGHNSEDEQLSNEGYNCGSMDRQNGNERDARKETRSKYRDIIDSVQQNREDLMSPSNNKLTEVLEEADRLFNNVRETSEAVLDSKFLVVATDLNNEKASQMQDEGSAFDLSAFAQHLLSFMGLNRLESGGEEQSEDEISGYLPSNAWQRVALRAGDCFSTAPAFHYMLGSFHAEPPPPKQKTGRQRRAPNKEAKRIMPTQLKKLDETEQEATEKEVERILYCLKRYHQDDPSSPISYYEFVIDPDSFSRTVENIFHTSFLIRDSLARIGLDQHKLPYIAPVEEAGMEIPADAGGSDNRVASIISISPKIWKELIDAFDIRDAMIPPLKNQ